MSKWLDTMPEIDKLNDLTIGLDAIGYQLDAAEMPRTASKVFAIEGKIIDAIERLKKATSDKLGSDLADARGMTGAVFGAIIAGEKIAEESVGDRNSA